MTIHPAHSAHKLAANLATIQVLLAESPQTQAAIVKAVKQCQDTLKQLREQMNEQERKRQVAQQMFCDKLTFEFSINADFSDSYIRSYDDMITDCETIKSIVYSERQLQNMSDEHLFARVTILDTDPEA
jgi:methylthioribose-1-phosphate isomerase